MRLLLSAARLLLDSMIPEEQNLTMESNYVRQEQMLIDEAGSWPTSVSGMIIAALCAFIAATISLYQIYQHVTNYEDPLIQRYYIRIIFLIPNYALASLLSLAFENASLYIDTIRDMYEAFVIYTFMSLLLDYIGGAGRVEQFSIDRVVEPSILLGTCCLPAQQVNGQFVRMCKKMVLQFVITKPVLTVLTIVFYSQDKYDEGNWSLDGSYPYVQVIYNICYSTALLGLLHFYAGTRDLLKPYKPLMKFVVVKSVVFVTFWQGLLLSIIYARDDAVKSKNLQNWLLCVEMVPAALAMRIAFPASGYVEGRSANPQRNGNGMPLSNIGNVITITDVYHDLRHQFVPVYSGYTCYDNVDEPEKTSKIFRARTYVMKDTDQHNIVEAHESPARTQVDDNDGAASASRRTDDGSSCGVSVGDLMGSPTHDHPSPAPFVMDSEAAETNLQLLSNADEVHMNSSTHVKLSSMHTPKRGL